jgi:hypothetical protein
LSEDARPDVQEFDPGANVLRATHHGYERLAQPVTVERAFRLEPQLHALAVIDVLSGDGDHTVEIPLHLAPGVAVTDSQPGRCLVDADGASFVILWAAEDHWTLEVGAGWVSPSYGVKHEIARLAFRRSGPLRPLSVVIAPAEHAAAAWKTLVA